MKLELVEDAPRRRVFSVTTDAPLLEFSHPHFLGGQGALLANDRILFRCGPPGARYLGVAMVSSILPQQIVLEIMASLPIGEGDT